MKRRQSLGELRFPDAPATREVAVAWAEEVVEVALALVWKGFDKLYAESLSGVDLASGDFEQLERELVQWHFKHIQDHWKLESFLPFTPAIEAFEFSRRTGGNAVPPSNDLAFVHNTSLTWKLPVEAKVVPTDGAVAEYLKDLNEKFLPGIAAPLVGQGGQIAYLLRGDAQRVLNKLGRQLQQSLGSVPSLATRAHRTSEHDRTTAPRIRIHHMVMSCAPKAIASPK